MHNKQLDQKTEQLEVYMIQNETLSQEVEHLKLTMTHDQETLLQERKEKAVLEVAVTTM